jgi:hypothetical protein
MSTATKTMSKSAPLPLTEEEKAADKTKYILNPSTKKHVLLTSVNGKKIANNEQLADTLTATEVQIKIITALQGLAPSALSDSAIKKVISSLNTELDFLSRTFPSKWGGKGKGPKIPGLPKGTFNSYIFFTQDERPNVVAKNPNFSAKDTMKEMGRLWTNLKDRTKYTNLADADKKRHAKEMKAFYAEHPEHAPKPKKPTKTNAFLVYQKEQIALNKPSSEISDNWKTTEAKETYQKKADVINKNYAVKFSEYSTLLTAYNNAHGIPEKVVVESTDTVSEAEKNKASNTELYVLNPVTNKHVLRTSKKGRALSKTVDEDSDLLEGL